MADRIKKYAVKDQVCFSKLISLSGLTTDHVIPYSDQEFAAKFTNSIECLTERSVSSLHAIPDPHRHAYVANIRTCLESPVNKNYIYVGTLRPCDDDPSQLELDQDPIFIPLGDDGNVAQYGYRLTHGGRVKGWINRSLPTTKFDSLSDLVDNSATHISAVSSYVPELSGMFTEPVTILENYLRRNPCMQ